MKTLSFFKKLQLDFENLNVFVGDNGTGKTALLNAIMLALGSEQLPRKSQFYEKNTQGLSQIVLELVLRPNDWTHLFKTLDHTTTDQKNLEHLGKVIVKITYELKYGRKGFSGVRRLEIKNPEFLAKPLADDAAAILDEFKEKDLAAPLGIVLVSDIRRLDIGEVLQLQKTGDREVLISTLSNLQTTQAAEYNQFTLELRSVFPELEFKGVSKTKRGFDILVQHKDFQYTYSSMSAGMRAILLLYLYALSPKARVLLLDAPESFLHQKGAEAVSNFLVRISTKKQLFIASHRLGFIQSLRPSSTWYLRLKDWKHSEVRPVQQPSDILPLVLSTGTLLPENVESSLKSFSTTGAYQDLEKTLDEEQKVDRQILGIAKDVMLSYYHPSDIEAMSVPLQKGTQCYDLADELAKCPKGDDDWAKYQDICRRIFSYLFIPLLREPEAQSRSDGDYQIRDLVIQIPYDADGFWKVVREVHGGLAVVADCKNHNGLLPQTQITLMSKYFGQRRLGKFGLVLTRNGIHANALEEIKRLWTSDPNIMIIPLQDADLIDMLKLKQNKQRPDVVIDAIYRRFRTMLHR